jgi:hypothetical protein
LVFATFYDSRVLCLSCNSQLALGQQCEFSLCLAVLATRPASHRQKEILSQHCKFVFVFPLMLLSKPHVIRRTAGRLNEQKLCEVWSLLTVVVISIFWQEQSTQQSSVRQDEDTADVPPCTFTVSVRHPSKSSHSMLGCAWP